MASSLNIQQILLSNTFDEFRISSNTVIDELNKFGTGSATVTVGSIVISTGSGESGNLTVGNDLDVTGESSFGGIGSNLVPALGNTYDLGSGAEAWNNLYLTGTANIDILSATSGSTVNDFQVGGNLTVIGDATISGNLTFGDAETDTITLSADVASSILPENSNAYDLGSLSKQWRDIYLGGTANVNILSATSGSVSGDFTVDTTTFHVDSTTNRVGILNTSPDVSFDVGSATDAIHIPVGTTEQRPGTPDAGYFRYNTSLNQFEGYTSTWGAIGGGGTNTFTTDTYTGDGVETEFVLSQSTESESNLMVFVDGIFQNQDAYNISTTGGITTLIFSEAPANTRSIVVYVVAAGVSGNNLNQDSFEGDGILQVFTLSIPPINENNTQVFIDGVYQQKDAYTISGYDIQFSEAPPSGTTIEVMTFTQTEVNVPANNTVVSASLAGDLVTPGSLTVTTDLIVTGDTTLNGNLYFGDAQTDTITFAGEISSHILPSVDITYDLGSATNRWRDLYLSGNTIYIGDGKIEYNDGTNEFELKNSIDQTVKISLSANTTTDLSEGSNKYYTAARVLTDGVGIVPAGSLRGTLSDVRMQYGVAYDSSAGAPQAGSFFFDSLNSKLKVHTGSTFIDAVPAGGGGGGGGDTSAANATFRKYSYTTTSETNIIIGEEDPTTDSGNFVVGRTYKIVSLGTTDFAAEHPATAVNSVGDEFVAEVEGTGTGTASQVLEYIVDGSQNIEVYINGVKQFEGATQDYVATTGSSINFTYTLPIGANVDVQVYELLTNDSYYLKSETYTQAETNTQISTALSTYDDQANSDARYVNIDGDTMTGTLVVADSLNGDPVLAHFYNDDVGTLAEATVYISNNDTTNGGLFLQATGSGFTTQDGFVQDAAVLGATSNASGGLSIMTRSNSDIRFYTNGHTNERVRITNQGRVGIGTNNPLAALTVSNGSSGIEFQPEITANFNRITNYNRNTSVYNELGIDAARIEIRPEGVRRLSVATDEIVVNEDGNDSDFRVESVSNENMLFVDAGNNVIGTGTGSPATYVGSGGLAIKGSTTSDLSLVATGIVSETNSHQIRYWNDTGTAYEIARTRVNVGAGQVNRGEYQFSVNNGAGLRPWLDVDYAGNVVFNQQGYDSDFRVESNGNPNMLFVDGGNDVVNIGTSGLSTTGAKLAVQGPAAFNTDSGTNKIYITRSGGTNQSGSFYVDDNTFVFDSVQDETSGANFLFRATNATASNVSYLELDYAGGTTFNQGGLSQQDFRVESVSNENMLFVDADTNRVGVGTGTPGYLLDVLETNTGGLADFRLRNAASTNAASGARNIIQVANGDVGDPRLVLSIEGIQEYTIGIDNSDSDILKFNNGSDPSASTNYLSIGAGAGGVVVNDGSDAAIDFRVESDSQTHMLFVDASTNRIGINTSAPDAEVHISGTSPHIDLGPQGSNRAKLGYASTNLYLGTTSGGGEVIIKNNIGSTDAPESSGDEIARFGDTIVFNEGNRDQDFRVESLNNENMLLVDAGNNNVIIGGADNNALSSNVLVVAGDTSLGNRQNNNASYITTELSGLSITNGTDWYGSYGALRFHANTSWTASARQFLMTNGYKGNQFALLRGTGTADAVPSISATLGNAVNATEIMTVEDGGHVVFNDGGNDQDFRVQSVSNENMLFVDAGTDNVGINNSAPTAPLDVRGTSKNSHSALFEVINVVGAGGNMSSGTPQTMLTISKFAGSSSGYRSSFTGTVHVALTSRTAGGTTSSQGFTAPIQIGCTAANNITLAIGTITETSSLQYASDPTIAITLNNASNTSANLVITVTSTAMEAGSCECTIHLTGANVTTIADNMLVFS